VPEDTQTEKTDIETADSDKADPGVDTEQIKLEAPDAKPVDPEQPHGGATAEGSRASRADRLEVESDTAADFLEELLDIADLDGDIEMDVDGSRASVSIVGGELDDLVGKDGEVLEALQELTRLAVFRETGERSHLMLDVAGHRAGRRKVLVELANSVVQDVKESGEAVKLTPMSPFERKVVHDAVADAGLNSESEGVEPRRCVVVLPAS
jgi:spoIIIJ-associated protein